MASSPLQSRLDQTFARADEVLAERLRREEAELEREDAAREAARRARMRDNAEERRQIQATYADAYAAFGTEVPASVDDENPERYRVRLFNRVVRKLPEGHEWSRVRADELPLGPAMDNIEALVLAAAKAEGMKPSFDSLPPDGSLISRSRIDSQTNARSVEWYGKESFVKDFTRPGRRVARIVHPSLGAIWGAAFSKAG